MYRVGVFGASFNPPTLGHQDVIFQALPLFDTVLLVPSLAHPFQKSLIAVEDRLAMLDRLVKSWPESTQNKVVIFNIEAQLQHENPQALIYSYDVLTAITAFYQQQSIAAEITFIVGPDIAAPKVWQTFYRYQDIEKTWPLFVAKEQIPIHSTLVKEKIAQYQEDRPSLEKALAPLVGERVMQYIIERRLYRQGR